MRNDYRDYIQHGGIADGFHKFIKKVKTKTGNWRYIYEEPIGERIKEKLKKSKRDVSYTVRNLASKITKKNNRFLKNVTIPQADGSRMFKDNIHNYDLERLQRNVRAKYQNEANRRMYSRQNAMAGDSRYKTNAGYYNNIYRNENAKSNAGLVELQKRKKIKPNGVTANPLAAAEFNKKMTKLKNIADTINNATGHKKKKKKKTLKDLFN